MEESICLWKCVFTFAYNCVVWDTDLGQGKSFRHICYLFFDLIFEFSSNCMLLASYLCTACLPVSRKKILIRAVLWSLPLGNNYIYMMDNTTTLS